MGGRRWTGEAAATASGMARQRLIIRDSPAPREATSRATRRQVPVKCRFAIALPHLVKFLLDNILLVVALVASGGYLLWPLVSRGFHLGGGRQVGTLEATRLINANALVLDVRDAAEFAAGHIPNARHIPTAELEKRLGEIAKYKERPVIISCRNGMRAAAAAKVLARNSFTQVYQLRGGIAAWQEASLTLSKA